MTTSSSGSPSIWAVVADGETEKPVVTGQPGSGVTAAAVTEVIHPATETSVAAASTFRPMIQSSVAPARPAAHRLPLSLCHTTRTDAMRKQPAQTEVTTAREIKARANPSLRGGPRDRGRRRDNP